MDELSLYFTSEKQSNQTNIKKIYHKRLRFKCLYPLIHIKNKLGKQIQNQSFNKLEMNYVQKWTTFVNFPFIK